MPEKHRIAEYPLMSLNYATMASSMILPLPRVIKNWYSVLLLGLGLNSNIRLRLASGRTVNTRAGRRELIWLLISAKLMDFAVKTVGSHGDVVELCFDGKRSIPISLDFTKPENRNLVEMLYLGMKFGATFSSGKEADRLRGDAFLLTRLPNGEMAVRTPSGIRFYMKYMDAFVFTETYLLRIHDMPLDMRGKIVIDAGASIGDTALFFAERGARVYAIEPVKKNYDAMLRNVKLNPSLAGRIKPVKAAIGDGSVLEFSYSPAMGGGGTASAFGAQKGFVKYFGLEKDTAQSYTLSALRRKLGLKKVYLLKMDCKGSEFGLTRKDLENVENIYLEYTLFGNHKLEDLTGLIGKDFEYTIFNHNPTNERLSRHGTIIASRKRA